MKRAFPLVLLLTALAARHAHGAPAESDPYAASDAVFANFVLDAHIPGLVYGVVEGGRLVHVKTFGVQDLESKRPVTPDTLFRIASMTKAFTALTVLKLRDEGKLKLDDLAEQYVPELRGWRYPTLDSPRIRVRDLLNHVAGFVTDDPWGDRQTPMAEKDFTALLRAGVPFTRAPQTQFEYSNLGFAILGRTVSNVSRAPFEQTISQTILEPLGMSSSGFVADAAPRERRALGYRWEDDAWRLEPTLGPGAFGAMGGIQTSANDYAKWVAFLLSAWPPRDDADNGPVKRATVRELAQGSNFPSLRLRPGHDAPPGCRLAATYGMGMLVMTDCELGFALGHGGGYPGYGSYVLLFPNRGAGLFAFANRTYAGPSGALWDAAAALARAGTLGAERGLPVSAALQAGYRAAGAMYRAGDVNAAGNLLAMNFLLDRSADGRARDFAALRAAVGECDTDAPPTATGALTAEFTWKCTQGRVSGNLELAPTDPPRIQELLLKRVAP